MNKLILCEGKTDAILLSYYLGKTAGWKPEMKKVPKGLDIKNLKDNESICWYKKDGDYLLICGVGGKDNFGNFFNHRIKEPLILTNAFEKIAIVTDRDNRGDADIVNSLSKNTAGFFDNVQNQKWCDKVYEDKFRKKIQLNCCWLLFPRKTLVHWKL